ncbi:MAG: uncharacterized protein KVP18_000998 [Porospora cf. gigantea A]|uniref:uncharacterized protein n=1 Tax=Porospora cf. gigantea A TaxID=2853593 RepID=UPI00355A6064|nr:MAG: hypothetical protein KVP18_000998 [Porospora cf. gigantea A]
MAQGQPKKKKKTISNACAQRKRAPQKGDGNKKHYASRLRKGVKLITEREVEKRMVEVSLSMRERLQVVHKTQPKAPVVTKQDGIVKSIVKDIADN